jgi:hypothetical protein
MLLPSSLDEQQKLNKLAYYVRGMVVVVVVVF